MYVPACVGGVGKEAQGKAQKLLKEKKFLQKNREVYSPANSNTNEKESSRKVDI